MSWWNDCWPRYDNRPGFGGSRWDEGVTWHLEQEVEEEPDFALDPLTVAFVRDQHLRTSNGDAEDDYIAHLMRASLRIGQNATARSWIPQGWTLVADRFPSSEFLMPMPPLLSVESIDYIDENGDPHTLTGSPAQFLVSAPSGPKAKYGRLTPLVDESWPGARTQDGAVRVHFQAGYRLTAGSPQVAGIPDDLTEGRLLLIGEMYKQRSESVHAFNQNPALIRARSLFTPYKVY